MSILFKKHLGFVQLAFLGLLIVSIIWGSSFIVIKYILSELTSFNYLFQRFFIAILLLSIFFTYKKISLQTLVRKEGIFLGCILALDYGLSSWGVQYTSASNATLIANMFIVLTPLLEFFIYKKRISAQFAVGAGIALLGISMISIREDFSFQVGDVIMLLAACFFSLHLILAEHYKKKCSSEQLLFSEISTVCILSFIGAITTGGVEISTKANILFSLLYLSCFATIGAYYIIFKAEQKIPSEQVAGILSFQGVCAVVMTLIFGLETFQIQTIGGAFLITCALLIIERKKIRRHAH